MSLALSSITEALSGASQGAADFYNDNKTASIIGGIGAVGALTYIVKKSSSNYKRKPSSLQLGSGNIAGKEVDVAVSNPLKVSR